MNSRSSSSLFDSKELNNRNKQTQTRQWIVGNKIIQITTGLFSNICVEDQSLLFKRKQRGTSGTSTSTTNRTIKQILKTSAPIPIENSTGEEKRPSTIGNNSSQGSSQASTANNSYSSVSISSSCTTGLTANSETASVTTAVSGGKEIVEVFEETDGSKTTNEKNSTSSTWIQNFLKDFN